MGQAETPSRTALVVEDDPDLRHLAAIVLEETDMQVVEAASAEDALGYLRFNADDVAFALVDVRLSRHMDGVELARRLRAKWPWIKVVLTSGCAGAQLAALPRNTTYLQKPWRALDVLVEAERAVRRTEMRAA